MAKWKTPYSLTGKLASRDQRKVMDKNKAKDNTCKFCKGLFAKHSDKWACEAWHKRIFSQMRSDIDKAIQNAHMDMLSKKMTEKEGKSLIKSLLSKAKSIPRE
jgi:hypothetical protein